MKIADQKVTDVLIVGGGMVGLSIANQLLDRGVSKKIVVLDKEIELGLHSSGRNSGVLHAGIYYKPDSIKAAVSVDGSRRLRNWVEERDLPLNCCGKIIVPQRLELDPQLEVLAHRGRANGAKVELLDQKQLLEFSPQARSASGRALWSPNTVVVKPLAVLKRLESELLDKGVQILRGEHSWKPNPANSFITLRNGSRLYYGHLINCAGLLADKVAHSFNVGLNYKLLPFKGSYWQIKKDSKIKINTNLYPVPDLNTPFLGIHFTPSADIIPKITIGPTAVPALGRENYIGIDGIEPLNFVRNLSLIGSQYLYNKGGFRRYVHEQAFLSIPRFLIDNAKQLIPSISIDDIEISEKVGIRAQLFNQSNQKLEDDFLCLQSLNSTHVLNAISPAFTASFALADLILQRAGLCREIS